MVNIDLWQSNQKIDPQYPFRTRMNEKGEIVYSVPLEAPNDIPADESEGAMQYEYSYLPLPGGKRMRVCCWETTDREWAYRVRRMMNAALTQEHRYAKRFIAVPEIVGNRKGDGNRKISRGMDDDTWDAPRESDQPAPVKVCGYEQREWPDVQKQVIDRIELEEIGELMNSIIPRLWQFFCRIRLYGAETRAVADELEITPQRLSQMISEVQAFARKYHQENY